VLSSIPPHKASSPGVTCLDLIDDWVVTGGIDTTLVLLSRSGKNLKKESVLNGHSKKITKVRFHQDFHGSNVRSQHSDLIVSSSLDNTARIWRRSEPNNNSNWKSVHVINTHQSGVTSLDIHPQGDHLLTSSRDSHWALSDLSTGQTLLYTPNTTQSALTSCQIHPDGLIFGTGAEDNQVRMGYKNS